MKEKFRAEKLIYLSKYPLKTEKRDHLIASLKEKINEEGLVRYFNIDFDIFDLDNIEIEQISSQQMILLIYQLIKINKKFEKDQNSQKEEMIEINKFQINHKDGDEVRMVDRRVKIEVHDRMAGLENDI